MGARVRQFLAVLGWVLLGIGCFFLSMLVIWQLNAQNVDIRVLQYCGRDGGGSLLIVTTG